MSGATNRRKGHDTERMVVKWLRDNGFPDAYTTRSRLGHDGFSAPGDVVGPVGIVIEVKNVAGSAWPSWVRQAVTEAGPDRVPVVVRRTPRSTLVGEWTAVAVSDAFGSGYALRPDVRCSPEKLLTRFREGSVAGMTMDLPEPRRVIVGSFAAVLRALDAYPVEVER